MAGPGDPEEPKSTPAHDPDDLVGFASPAHLTGRVRAPEPDIVDPVEPAPEPDTVPEPVSESVAEPVEARPVVEAPEPAPIAAAPVVAPVTAAPPPRIERPEPPRQRPAAPSERARPATPPPAVAAPMSLYAVYALILFAVPTLGASAALALLAVTGREGPSDPVAGSHFIFQQRTLWTGAVVALLGVILIVINVGVFVLFIVALWLLARGVWGVLRLKSGQPIPNPRSWLF